MGNVETQPHPSLLVTIETEAHDLSSIFDSNTPEGITLRRQGDYCGIPLVRITGPYKAVCDFYLEQWIGECDSREDLENEVDSLRVRDEEPRGGNFTYPTVAARYEAVARMAATGLNYFVGYHDSGDPAKPFGLSCGLADWVNGVYMKDLGALIH